MTVDLVWVLRSDKLKEMVVVNLNSRESLFFSFKAYIFRN